MLETPRRTALRGPTFIRLLAGLTDADIPHSRQSLPDRLSQWIDWTHAVALSTALDDRPAAAEPDPQTVGDSEDGDCARVRALLASAIAGDRAFSAEFPAEFSAVGPRGSAQAPGERADQDAAPDYAFFRQRCLAMQQAMDTHIGPLRGRLRDRLSRVNADLARLAAVDAVMERALGRRERNLLAAVPALLAQHFDRLRQRQIAAQETATTAPAAASGAWLNVFRKDMQSVLLAELDVRLQPAEGLLAALRTSPLGSHVQKSA